MQALRKWARSTFAYVALERPDWDEWWEEFKRFNPVSAQVTEEFWKKYRKKLDRLDRRRFAVRSNKTALILYENYYAKRVYELRKDPKYASLFRRWRRLERRKRKKINLSLRENVAKEVV